MAPLYVALVLGYGSVKWWQIFSPDQTDTINRLVCYFTLPLFTFEFTAHVDPFDMNYLFIGADAISKLIIVIVLAFWAKCSSKGSYCWSITSFSLATLTNALVVGVPLMKAMYGQLGVDLVVQSSVVQAIIWLSILLFVLEFRRTGTGISSVSSSTDKSDSGLADVEPGKALETNEVMTSSRLSFWLLMSKVGLKLAQNPNSYACIIGITWAFISKRYAAMNFQLD